MIRATEINTTVFDPPEPTRRFAEEKDETRNYDCVFFLYAGSPGASKNTSSSKELYDLKTLAPYTANSPVAFFVQGYEETETGKWQTARYSIYGGQVHDETSLILGVRYIYDDKDKSLKGTVEASGRKVSLLDPTSFRNFLASGMNRFPSAKNRVLSISTHGHGFEASAGEAVVKANQSIRRGLSVHCRFTRNRDPARR
ncbi:MAG: hypothetical protein HYU64_16285 [Armatimonadetes bacterium]|nr:hypothetical protein [Armatimonadota bacterium]